MNYSWYYLTGTKKHGPFTQIELLKNITQDTLVWRDGFTDWRRADEVDELRNAFTKMPPPAPSVTEDRQEGFQKIKIGIVASWFLIILSIIDLFLIISGDDEGNIYKIIATASVFCFIKVLQSTKTYLSVFRNYNRTNKNINWLIGLSILFALMQILNLEHIDELFIDESILIAILITAIIMFVLYIYHNLRFAIRLIKLNDSSIKALQYFAILQIFAIAIFLPSVFMEEEITVFDNMSNIIEIVSYIFLLSGLTKVKRHNEPTLAV